MSVQETNIEQNLRQQIVDEEHLKLLRIGFLVSAAMTAFVSLFGLLYGLIGILVLSAGARQVPAANQPSQEFVGWIFGLVGFVVAAGAVAFAAAKVYAAQCLKQRRSRIFCLIVAAITCLGIPEGTFLGICTLMVLNRPSVSRLFDASSR